MDLGSLLITFPDGQTLSFPVPRAVTLIGRAPNNDILVEHASISRRHARLVVEPGRLQLDDLGSANGSSVNGEKLLPGRPHRLSGHETIRLGELTVRYHAPAVPLAAQAGIPSATAPTVVSTSPVDTVPGGPVLAPEEEQYEADFQSAEETLPAEEDGIEEPASLPVWVLPFAALVGLCFLLALAAVAYFAFAGGRGGRAGAVPVIRTFTVSPAEVPPGGSATLAWEVTGAEIVGIEPGIGTVDASGTRAVVPLQSSVFTLIAVSSRGTVTGTVEVKVAGSLPVIQSFSAEPSGVVRGQTQQIKLSWSVAGAESVNIPGLPPPFDLSGSRVIPAPQNPTTYTLVAVNKTGEARKDLLVNVISSGCAVSGVDSLNMRTGPGVVYPIVLVLANGAPVEPLGRMEPPDWLKVRAQNNQEGWVSSAYVTCAVGIVGFPTVDPTLLPPTPTGTPTPTVTPTGTATPLPTITPSPTPGPTATPRFLAGQVAYKTGPAGDVSLLAILPNGQPFPLMEHKTDLAVLDYTNANGGVYLLWVKEGAAESVALVRFTGGLLRGGIHPDPQWATITDGDFAPDGSRFVVEAVAAGKTAYYFFDNAGNLLSAPALLP